MRIARFTVDFLGISSLLCVGLLCVGLLASRPLSADEPPNVLDVPMLMQQQMSENMRAVGMLRKGEYGSAKILLRKCVLRVPYDLMAVYNLACAHAKLGQNSDAIDMLKLALKLGFRNKQQLQADEDLASLRNLPEFAEILKGCDEPMPKQMPGWQYNVKIAKPEGAQVAVDHQNMTWNAAARAMQVFIDSSNSGQDRLSAGTTGALGDKIMKWYSEGTAAGNVGDLYDNHDRGHSLLDLARYPQLCRIVFGPETQKRDLDMGPQRMFLYLNAKAKDEAVEKKSETGTKAAGASPAPAESAGLSTAQMQVGRTIVLGNSSTAITGSALWRSMPRMLLTNPGGPELLTQHYTHNHLYVYPEHKDHDAGRAEGTGWGDVFFANTPFYFLSQGSSGSDQPIVDALAATLSAFRPETKTFLREKGLVTPMMQMIFRRCYKLVKSDQDYLSGIAHPTVFEGNQVDADAMVEMAHSIKLDELPPIALLRVLQETLGDPSRDYFDAQPSEAVITTPFALARVCNSTAFWREITVTAADSMEINKRPLRFHWVILRGDPDLIKIDEVPGIPAARRIRIGYQTHRPVQAGSDIESSRVDIALFAHNGIHYSPPAIMSFFFPENETRVYDDQKRILSVDYRGNPSVYVDPVVVPERIWKDEYHYDETGKLSGWTRFRARKQEEFNAEGQLLVPSPKKNEPPQAKRVIYQRLNHSDGRPFISQKLADE